MIRAKVGYPLYPNTTDDRSIARYYISVQPDPKQFLNNRLSAVISETKKTWAALGRTKNDERWTIFPTTVNAYFDSQTNEVRGCSILWTVRGLRPELSQFCCLDCLPCWYTTTTLLLPRLAVLSQLRRVWYCCGPRADACIRFDGKVVQPTREAGGMVDQQDK